MIIDMILACNEAAPIVAARYLNNGMPLLIVQILNNSFRTGLLGLSDRSKEHAPIQLNLSQVSSS